MIITWQAVVAGPAPDARAPGLPATAPWTGPDRYVGAVRELERAGVDLVVLADTPDLAVTPALDAGPLAAVLAAATDRIGLAPVLATAGYPPFMLARLVGTLDHLSGGRIAWASAVERGRAGQVAFGHADDPVADRYRRADELVEVCRALWRSWDPDAVVGDWHNGVFADPAKVREIHHDGPHFTVRGPLNVVASPQQVPPQVHVVDGTEDIAFAARWADIAVVGTPDGTAAGLLARAAAVRQAADGRAVRVLASVAPVVAASAAAAAALTGPACPGALPFAGTATEVADGLVDLVAAGALAGLAWSGSWAPQAVQDLTARVLPLLRRRGVLAARTGRTLAERLGIDSQPAVAQLDV